MIWDTAPLLATVLMSLSSGLIGAIVYWQKRLLISETLSHATLPGVALGVCLGYPYLGALFSSLAGLCLFHRLRKNRVREDAALTFILSFFMGIGVCIISFMQALNPASFRSVSLFFYGQSATLCAEHVLGYALLLLAVLVYLAGFYGRLKVALFDATHARTIGIQHFLATLCLSVCLLGTIIFGIRSVGVILMTGMLVIPPCIARLLSRRFLSFIGISVLFSGLSALIGNALSYLLPTFPTGPMILLCSGSLFILVWAFQECGYKIRSYNYRARCHRENVLKQLWKGETVTRSRHLNRLRREGFVSKKGEQYHLTAEGQLQGARITRAHRLWEVYLAQELGLSGRIIHTSASQIEHLISKRVDVELTEMLGNPKKDPHNQPIPKRST